MDGSNWVASRSWHGPADGVACRPAKLGGWGGMAAVLGLMLAMLAVLAICDASLDRVAPTTPAQIAAMEWG